LKPTTPRRVWRPTLAASTLPTFGIPSRASRIGARMRVARLKRRVIARGRGKVPVTTSPAMTEEPTKAIAVASSA
jgi:hypothetical protein